MYLCSYPDFDLSNFFGLPKYLTVWIFWFKTNYWFLTKNFDLIFEILIMACDHTDYWYLTPLIKILNHYMHQNMHDWTKWRNLINFICDYTGLAYLNLLRTVVLYFLSWLDYGLMWFSIMMMLISGYIFLLMSKKRKGNESFSRLYILTYYVTEISTWSLSLCICFQWYIFCYNVYGSPLNYSFHIAWWKEELY